MLIVINLDHLRSFFYGDLLLAA